MSKVKTGYDSLDTRLWQWYKTLCVES